jgi:hypothetical protein
VKTVLTWLAIAIGAMWLLKNPAQAAALIQQFAHALSTLASSL